MIEKKQDITNFLKKHFTPGTLEDYTFLKNNQGVLNLLFNVFPSDCIDTYDLYEIMTSLDYKPVKQTLVEKPSKEDDNKEKIIVGFYWCLKSI